MTTANPCTCTNDSVKIDRAELLRNLGNNKKSSKGKKLMEIEDEPDHMDKTSSSTKSRRKSSDITLKDDHFNGGHAHRKSLEIKSPNQDKIKQKDSPRAKKSTKRTMMQKHPMLKKTSAYEPKSVRETRQKEAKDHTKVQQGSKKIKKASISPKNRAGKHSIESKAEILGETDNIRRIRRLVKAKDDEEVLFENWICCDECGKWRKIDDETLWSKIQGKPKILCKNLPGIVCGSPEENWKQTYYTVSEKVKSAH